MDVKTVLAGAKCTACRRGEPQATRAQESEYLKELPEWRVAEREGTKRLERPFAFPDFRLALEFSNRVGAIAEEQGHHPALLTEWGRVTVSWWTHAIGGLHKNDFIMAAKTDALYTR